MSISRRAFLGAAALSPLGVNASSRRPESCPTRAFGSTGVQVPLLAFGCGSRYLAYKDDDEAVGVLSRAIDAGFTLPRHRQQLRRRQERGARREA